jgi:hypothetical protein
MAAEFEQTNATKDTHMKTRSIITTTRSLVLGLGCAFAFTAFSGLQAQESGTAKGGAAKLMQFDRPAPKAETPASEKSDFKPMSCKKCTNLAFDRPVIVFKGGASLLFGEPPTEQVVQHQCTGCITTFKVVGHGKAKTQVPQHACTGCGSEDLACCSTSKLNSKPTPGMEGKL